MFAKHVNGMLFSLCVATIVFGQTETILPPIKVIDDVTPVASVFDEASRENPIVIRTQADAEKHFASNDVGKLLKQIDFKKQIVLVFAWRGSGRDRLEYSVLESFPEQIVFSFKPGRTKDYVPHIHVFALRANVKWNGNSAKLRLDEKEYIKVEVKGELNSQVFAIGGETTGVQVSANGIVWELDLGKNEEFQKNASKLNGKVVVVTGLLSKKFGVEIKERWIVKVASLREATANANEQ